MQRYFIHSHNKNTLPLNSDQKHHMINVMRMRVGDYIEVVLLDKTAGKAIIAAMDNQNVTLQWVEDDTTNKELPITVTIACGIPKGDKLEWIVQKATELGVSKLMPIETDWSVVKWDSKKQTKKIERLQKIAQEAAEQSRRNVIPTIKPLCTIAELANQFSHYTHVLVAYEEQAKSGEMFAFKQVVHSLKGGEKLLVIFGSEGGLAPREIEKCVTNGAVLCGLGPRIMRAETAPLYVLSALSYALELG